jgi:signal transduction histidine kinase
MKFYFLLFILFSSILFSQTNFSGEKADSISYYTHLKEKYLGENKYSKALNYSQKAVNYSIANNLIEEQIIQHFSIGKLYYDVKKYDDALISFNKSVFLSRAFNPNSFKVSLYYYIGKCYMKKENYDNAKTCFELAESIYQSLNINQFSDLINLENGIIYIKKGDLKSARTIFNTIISKPDNPSVLDTKAEALYQMGKIEMDENRNNLALFYFKKALEVNLKNKNLEQKLIISLALSMVYDIMLDKNNAYLFLKQHVNLRESIAIIDNERLGVDEYEKFKETERINDLEKENNEKNQLDKNNKFSKLISILALALISILSLLSLSLYKNNNIKKQSNSLLEEKNKELITAKDNAIKASKARSEFLSTVSHELRTPLNAINGITHLLLEEKPKKSQMHYLKSLQFSGNYLTNFINDILEINKIESNKAHVEGIPFNLKELIQNIHNSLIELAKVNNNTFSFDIDSKIPDYLIGDPTKLSQILLNLINNALKFTHNGNAIIRTNLISLENKKVQLYFEVTDTGIGIPEDKLETVFDSFSQGSVGINRKFGGTGLGLTIVKKLVEILDGQIKIKSIVDKGTTFSFQLPFTLSDKPLKIKVKNIPNTESNLNGKKILIVEDNKINQMVTKKMLENRGVLCKIVENGEDAIEIVKNNTYDLILMDIHLPGINGTISTKSIREFNTTTPIIALTAISLNENRNNILSFGMNDIITKPFVPEEFYRIISKYI